MERNPPPFKIWTSIDCSCVGGERHSEQWQKHDCTERGLGEKGGGGRLDNKIVRPALHFSGDVRCSGGGGNLDRGRE
jgi:hypothetical protein